MRAWRLAAIALAAVALLAVFASVAYAANRASDSLVTFYTEKPSYLPNSDIKIVAKFSSPFTGTYVLRLVAPNGTVIDVESKNVEDETEIVYIFHHDENLYGYGEFKATFSYSGYIVVNGQKQNVYSSSPLEITFIVAPSYSISGKVVDEVGNPVEGATVYVVEANVKVTTGSDGSFVVPVKSPGNYTIVVSKPDYMSNTTTVSVKSVGTTTLPSPIVIVSQSYMIQQLLAAQKSLVEQIGQLSDKIDQLATKVDALANSLNDLAGKVNDNAKAIAENANAIKANADSIKAIKDELDNVKKSIDDVKASIDQLRSLLDEYATKNYVDTKVAAEVQNAVNSLTAKINDLSEKIDELSSKLNEYATKSYVDSKASDLESKLTSEINSKISSLKAEIDSVKNDLSNLKSTVIQQLSQNLEKATNNANRASNIALIAVTLAIIGIIIAIVVAIRLMKLTTA
jgi:predicted RNase H-like nuclease (RuvC/YqgF family)